MSYRVRPNREFQKKSLIMCFIFVIFACVGNGKSKAERGGKYLYEGVLVNRKIDSLSAKEMIGKIRSETTDRIELIDIDEENQTIAISVQTSEIKEDERGERSVNATRRRWILKK
jgi:hypothetical protein